MGPDTMYQRDDFVSTTCNKNVLFRLWAPGTKPAGIYLLTAMSVLRFGTEQVQSLKGWQNPMIFSSKLTEGKFHNSPTEITTTFEVHSKIIQITQICFESNITNPIPEQLTKMLVDLMI